MLNVVKSTPEIQNFTRFSMFSKELLSRDADRESAEDLRSTNSALRDERELGFPQFLESFGLEKAASKKSWESEHPTKIVIRYW